MFVGVWDSAKCGKDIVLSEADTVATFENPSYDYKNSVLGSVSAAGCPTFKLRIVGDTSAPDSPRRVMVGLAPKVLDPDGHQPYRVCGYFLAWCTQRAYAINPRAQQSSGLDTLGSFGQPKHGDVFTCTFDSANKTVSFAFNDHAFSALYSDVDELAHELFPAVLFCDPGLSFLLTPG